MESRGRWAGRTSASRVSLARPSSLLRLPSRDALPALCGLTSNTGYLLQQAWGPLSLMHTVFGTRCNKCPFPPKLLVSGVWALSYAILLSMLILGNARLSVPPSPPFPKNSLSGGSLVPETGFIKAGRSLITTACPQVGFGKQTSCLAASSP